MGTGRPRLNPRGSGVHDAYEPNIRTWDKSRKSESRSAYSYTSYSHHILLFLSTFYIRMIWNCTRFVLSTVYLRKRCEYNFIDAQNSSIAHPYTRSNRASPQKSTFVTNRENYNTLMKIDSDRPLLLSCSTPTQTKSFWLFPIISRNFSGLTTHIDGEIRKIRQFDNKSLERKRKENRC